MGKYTYKNVLTQKKKGVNIIKDQARKRSIKTKIKKLLKISKKVLTIFDMRGNIYQDQATNEKILKYYTRISIKVSTKKYKKDINYQFFILPKKRTKKYLKYFLKKY